MLLLISNDFLFQDNLGIVDYPVPSKLSHVPEPLHLKDCASVMTENDLVPSPQHPVLTSRSVDKVNWWYGKIEKSEPQQFEISKEMKISKLAKSNKFKEPEMSKSMKKSKSSKDSMKTSIVTTQKEDETELFTFPAVDKSYSSQTEITADITEVTSHHLPTIQSLKINEELVEIKVPPPQIIQVNDLQTKFSIFNFLTIKKQGIDTNRLHL